jgi:uncharacterized protein
MIVYDSDIKGFRSDVLTNRIEERIHELFQQVFRRKTSPSEVTAWKNSLVYMNLVLAHPAVPENAGVAIEFLIPGMANRIDFVLTGLKPNKGKVAVIIELKQWTEATQTSKDGVVETYLGGAVREVNHPSYQAWSYAALLEDFNEAVRVAPIELRPCAYLHNCESAHAIRNRFYEPYLTKAPVFLRDDAEKLREFIVEHVRFGDNRSILFEIVNGAVRPSKNLADSLVGMLKGSSEFTLIDNQKLVFETALALAKKAQAGPKQVLIVEGGPGTGKSVVAINLLVRLIKGHLTAKYVTKNSAPRAVYEARLTGTLRKSRISNLFGGPDSFLNAKPDSFGALIVDEAHRLREKSGMFGNLGENQIKHLIEAARLSVFFVDDAQRVTLKDIGGVEEVNSWARKLGVEVTRMELPSQFRCGGSDGYLAWIDHILGIRDTANTTLQGINYDFRVCRSATELRELIRARNRINNKARLVAGYCWEWKSKKTGEGCDIVLPAEGFSAAWNFSRDGGTWLIRPDSVEQVGCIHTSQGLELDYVGVILGHDLVIRNGQWLDYPDRRARQDSSIKGYGKLLLTDRLNGERRIREVIRNTYRTLMTRGARGCYVYSVDRETNAFLQSAMGREVDANLTTASQPVSEVTELPFRILSPAEVPKVSNRVRYFPTIKAAAGAFSTPQIADEAVWVEISDAYRATPDMFIVQVVGQSMNRRIPDGSWCLFRYNPAGSREGKIVLVQHHSISDPESGGEYTVKRYRSEKRATEDGWAHQRITLWPESTDRTFTPFSISLTNDEEFKVTGEFVSVLELR